MTKQSLLSRPALSEDEEEKRSESNLTSRFVFLFMVYLSPERFSPLAAANFHDNAMPLWQKSAETVK